MGLRIENIAVARGGSIALRIDGEVRLASPGLVQVIGPNGGGKTTLLLALAGLAKTVRGRILVDGINIASDPEKAGRFVSFMPQDIWSRVPQLPLTPIELLTLHYKTLGIVEGVEPESLLESVGVSRSAARSPLHMLSPGVRQRVFLAIAVFSRKPIVLLDEPLSAIDPEGRVELSRVIAGASRDNLILVSSHDPELLLDSTSTIILVASGRLVAWGPSGEVLREDILERVYGELLTAYAGHLHITEGHH